MRCTERYLEFAGATLPCVLCVVAMTTASCVLDEMKLEPYLDDDAAADDAGRGEASSDDASTGDAFLPRDAAFPEPPKVVCPGSGPCAVALRAPPNGREGPVSDAFCALLSSGKVACWGSNTRGELGRATGDGGPAAATGLPGFVDGLTDAKELARGCALLNDASVVCWGRVVVPGTSDGRAPLPGLTRLPIMPARKISIAGALGCALLANDRVTCWGLDTPSGQLAYAKDARGEPVLGPSEIPLPEGARIVDVVVGEPLRVVRQGDTPLYLGGATYVLRADGAALSWGMNQSLGRISSLMPDPSPATVEISGIRFLAAGGAGACAIADYDLRCWGTSDGPPRAVPVYDPVHVATIGPRPLGRGCAVQRSGDVYCWGDNDAGQAGDGSTDVATSPVKVIGLPAPAISVEVTWKSSCAVLVDGRVFCWGDGARGQLGRVFLDGYSAKPLEVALPEDP